MQPEPIVYVIDDDDAVRQSLEFLLKTAGIQVRGFESAKAFLEKLPQIKSGCIVTDVRMPEITGIELLRRVKESGIDIPVIVITGHGDISLAVEAMKIGAVDFLEKPFDDDHLLEGATYPVLDLVEGRLVERPAPALNALNERLRDRYIKDTVSGVGR